MFIFSPSLSLSVGLCQSHESRRSCVWQLPHDSAHQWWYFIFSQVIFLKLCFFRQTFRIRLEFPRTNWMRKQVGGFFKILSFKKKNQSWKTLDSDSRVGTHGISRHEDCCRRVGSKVKGQQKSEFPEITRSQWWMDELSRSAWTTTDSWATARTTCRGIQSQFTDWTKSPRFSLDTIRPSFWEMEDCRQKINLFNF